MKYILLVFLISMLAACGHSDAPAAAEHKTTVGDVAGKAAYYAEKGTKAVVKETAKEVKTFAKDAKEGYHEAHQNDAAKQGK